MEEAKNATEPPNRDAVSEQQAAEAGASLAVTPKGSFHHAINLNTGQDVMASLFEVSAHYQMDVCIHSVVGAVSSVVLRSSLGTYTRHEGHFEIMSLTPTTYNFVDDGRVPGTFSISLADSVTGRVFGGVVVGSLIASGPVRLIVSEFKQSKEILKKNSEMVPPRMLSQGESSGSSRPTAGNVIVSTSSDNGGISDNTNINLANDQNMNSARQDQRSS